VSAIRTRRAVAPLTSESGAARRDVSVHIEGDDRAHLVGNALRSSLTGVTARRRRSSCDRLR
jgi:hypothetical protein